MANLNYIPGFRSRKTFKMIIAGIYYLVGLLLMISDITLGLFWISISFFIFAIIDLISKKYMFKSKRGLITFFIPLFLIIYSSTSMPKIATDNGVQTISKNTVEKSVDKKEEQKAKEDSKEENVVETQDKKENNIEEVIKSKINLGLGEDDTLVNVTFNNEVILVKVTLGDPSPLTKKDLAISRYGSISDNLLEIEGWKVLTVNVQGVGEISMDESQAVDDGNGKYFKSIEYEKQLF